MPIWWCEDACDADDDNKARQLYSKVIDNIDCFVVANLAIQLYSYVIDNIYLSLVCI